MIPPPPSKKFHKSDDNDFILINWHEYSVETILQFKYITYVEKKL